jgi:hypothetical protein
MTIFSKESSEESHRLAIRIFPPEFAGNIIALV